MRGGALPSNLHSKKDGLNILDYLKKQPVPQPANSIFISQQMAPALYIYQDLSLFYQSSLDYLLADL